MEDWGMDALEEVFDRRYKDLYSSVNRKDINVVKNGARKMQSIPSGRRTDDRAFTCATGYVIQNDR